MENGLDEFRFVPDFRTFFEKINQDIERNELERRDLLEDLFDEVLLLGDVLDDGSTRILRLLHLIFDCLDYKLIHYNDYNYKSDSPLIILP